MLKRIVATLLLAGAAAVQPQVAGAQILGIATPFSGETDDGREFKGATWVTLGDSQGRFCLVIAQEISCEGVYDAMSDAPVIERPFTCGALSGRFTVERVPDPRLGLMVPRRGSAALADGATARFSFGDARPYAGETLCPAGSASDLSG
jgi:hypothetical protein